MISKMQKKIEMSSNDENEFLNINDTFYRTRISDKFRKRKQYEPPDPKKILSFIPGTIIDIFVTPGQDVRKGDLLFILDAMKMKNRVKCHMNGRIKSVPVAKGDKVPKGTLLMELE